MLEFYKSLARRLPSVLRESIETVGFWLTLAASILAFFSPELAAKAGAAVPG